MLMCPIAHVPHPPRCPISICPCGLSYTHVPHCLCAPLAMCPITHVPHPPRCPISICSINHDTPFDHVCHCPCVLSYAHVPHCPCAPLVMYPITHVPHPPRCPSLSAVLTMIPHCQCVLLPICQKLCQVVKKMSICQKDVKLSKRCQFVKKMSSCQKDVHLSKRCQMSKSQTHGLWRRFTKKIN